MELNNEKINEIYLEICEKVTLNGEVIPYLIEDELSIENSHNYNLRVGELFSKLTSEQEEQRAIIFYNRRKEETEIMHKPEKERRKLLQEYLENEVKEFIKKYPEYEDIIIG